MAKNNKRRGFTLVELIVVLVILAILAALLIPALTGYIDKTKKNQVIAETRMLTQAAQTELVSLYASDEFGKRSQPSGQNLVVASKDGKAPEGAIAMDSAQSRYNDMVSLAELSNLTNARAHFSLLQISTAQSVGRFIMMEKVILEFSVRTTVQWKPSKKMKWQITKTTALISAKSFA